MVPIGKGLRSERTLCLSHVNQPPSVQTHKTRLNARSEGNCHRREITLDRMVFYFTSTAVEPAANIYVGKDKVESTSSPPLPPSPSDAPMY